MHEFIQHLEPFVFLAAVGGYFVWLRHWTIKRGLAPKTERRRMKHNGWSRV